MRRRAAILLLAATAGVARADDPPAAPGRARYEQGDYAGARAELLLAYERDPRPDLLFALGQVEYRLGNYQAAIDYYERFLASGPSAHDAALAQQALGAARTERDRPPPPPPPPPAPKVELRRRWTRVDWALAAGGALAIGAGAGLVAYGHDLGSDQSGTIAEFDARLREARRTQWIGLGVTVVGVAAITAAVIHYGVHRERVQIGVTATGDQIGVTLSGSL